MRDWFPQNQLGFKPSACLLLMFLGEVHENTRTSINNVTICGHHFYFPWQIHVDKINVAILRSVIKK